ncbi:COMD1 protein, partial [Ramphastos sulfuratus]|nr:COMD1 protein [Ramphastos sulfuratus]
STESPNVIFELEVFLTAQTKKSGGITAEQGSNHQVKVHKSLVSRNRWDNVLRSISWRLDLKAQHRHLQQINTTPVAIVEMELGKNGQ